jgi:hypothetical protein
MLMLGQSKEERVRLDTRAPVFSPVRAHIQARDLYPGRRERVDNEPVHAVDIAPVKHSIGHTALIGDDEEQKLAVESS